MHRRHLTAVVVLSVLATACNPTVDRIFLVAPAEYRGADVLLDGKHAARLDIPVEPGSWQDQAFRRRFPGAPPALVAAQIDLAMLSLAEGGHELQVRSAALPTLASALTVPVRRSESVVLVQPKPPNAVALER